MLNIKQAIDKINEDRQTSQRFKVKEPYKFSFGDKATCEKMLEDAWNAVDRTRKFEMLPEYKDIIDWMVDNNGKGLAMHGSIGRGKSIILMKVMPVMLAMIGKKFLPLMSTEYAAMTLNELQVFYRQRWFVGIDELGREPIGNNWGSKHESINYIIEHCEADMKPLLLTSNMTRQQVINRYGGHIWDRISRLCKVVEFSGKSLRK